MLDSDQQDDVLLDSLLSPEKSSSNVRNSNRKHDTNHKTPLQSLPLSDFDTAEITQLHENIKNYDNSRLGSKMGG